MTRKQYVTFVGGLINPLRQDLPEEAPVSLVKADNVLLNEFGGLSKALSTDLLVPKEPLTSLTGMEAVWTGPVTVRNNTDADFPYEDNKIMATVYRKFGRFGPSTEVVTDVIITFEGTMGQINITPFPVSVVSPYREIPPLRTDAVRNEIVGNEVIHIEVLENLPGSNYPTSLLIFNWPIVADMSSILGGQRTGEYHYQTITFYYNGSVVAGVFGSFFVPFSSDGSYLRPSAHLDIRTPTPGGKGIRTYQYINDQLTLTFYDDPGWAFVSAKRTGDYNTSNIVYMPKSPPNIRMDNLQAYNNFSFYVLWGGSRLPSPDQPFIHMVKSNEDVNFMRELRGVFLGTNKGLYHSKTLPPDGDYKLVDATPTLPNEAIIVGQSLYYLTDRGVMSVIYQPDIDNYAPRRVDGGMATYISPKLLTGGNDPYPWISFTTEEKEIFARDGVDQEHIVKWVYIGRIYSQDTVSFTRIRVNNTEGNTKPLRPFYYKRRPIPGIEENVVAYPSINNQNIRQATQPINLIVDNNTHEYANPGRWIHQAHHFVHSVAGFTVTEIDSTSQNPPATYNLQVDDTYGIGQEYLDGPSGTNPILLMHSKLTEEFLFVEIDQFPFFYSKKNIGNDAWSFFAGILIVPEIQLKNLIGVIGRTGKVYDSTLGLHKSGGFQIKDRMGKIIYEGESPNSSLEPYLYTGKVSVLAPTDLDDIVTFSIFSRDPARFTLINVGISYEVN